MPSSNAGRKAASSILSNGGAWNGRVLAVSKGFSAAAGVTSASAVGWSVAAGVPAPGAWPLHAARARLMAAARTNGRIIGGISCMARRGPEAVQGSAAADHATVLLVQSTRRQAVASPDARAPETSSAFAYGSEWRRVGKKN